MNFELLHPKIVHLPIALAMLMPLVSGGILLAWWKKWLPKRAWTIVLVLQSILVLSGGAALKTGEIDEEVVERVVAEQTIEAHEEAAEVFLISGGVVWALITLALLASGGAAGLPLGAAGFAGTLVVLALGYRTGKAGGELVYQHGAAAAFTTSGAVEGGTSTNRPKEHDDDDDEHSE